LLEQRMARLRSSGHKNRSVQTLHIEKHKPEEKFVDLIFLKSVSEHACIIH
jgi:hypothetical protein